MDRRRFLKKINPLRNRKGVTMVELIVVFALISMFVALSSQVITSSLQVYQKIQGIEYGRQVSDTIMNKIVGELSEAQNENTDSTEKTVSDMLGGEDSSNTIKFRNAAGSQVEIQSGIPYAYHYDEAGYEVADSPYSTKLNSQFILHYFVTKSSTETDARVIYEPTDWTFDENMYQGYEIESLLFSDPGDDYPDNVVCVQLTLESPSYGKYSATRFVECYNFEGYEAPTEPAPEPATPKPTTPETTTPEEITPPPPSNGGGNDATVVRPPNFPSDLNISSSDGYWPEDENDPLLQSEAYLVPEKRIFEWKGNYYVVYSDGVTLYKSYYDPSSTVIYGVIKWSGNTYYTATEHTGNFQPGDLCKNGDKWYIYTNIYYSDSGGPPNSNWHEVPGQ